MPALVRRLPAVMSVLTLAVFACVFTQNVYASVAVVVGDCKVLPRFNIIQDAINSVPPGATIYVCPGKYFEQLSINKSLTITGVSSGTLDAPVIVPNGSLSANTTSLATGNPIAAHVWVLGPATVNISNVIVDSLGNGLSGCSAPELVGILYQNAAGAVNHVVTRNQWIGTSESGGDNGCQNGLGIFVQSGNSGTSAVTVENSSVHDYQKNGITGNEVGTTITVKGNNVLGQGPTNGAAENGIQIGFGATGTVSSNLVIDDIWAPDTISDPGNAASGILLFDTSGTPVVTGNTVGNTQFGIAVVTDTSGEGDGASVTSNKVFGTRIFDAIDVCTNNNLVQMNTIMNSAESAIHLDASCGTLDGGTSGDGNTVSKNTIVDACTGVLEDSAVTGNTLTGNTFSAVGQTSGSSCSAPSFHVGGRRRPTAKRSGLKTAYRGPVRP